MNTKPEAKKSRHFTVVARRSFAQSVGVIFSAWTNPDRRRTILKHGRKKNGVMEVEIVEGGIERYEDRWKNHLYGKTIRRYLIIRPSKLIVSQSETSIENDMVDQHFARQELLLFKPKEDGCELVASDQCVSLEPTYIHAAENGLNEMFDIFAASL